MCTDDKSVEFNQTLQLGRRSAWSRGGTGLLRFKRKTAEKRN